MQSELTREVETVARAVVRDIRDWASSLSSRAPAYWCSV